MIFNIMLLNVLGLCVSIYIYLIEMRLKQDASFKPACDLSDRVSCTKTILSPYGKILSVSNAVIGIMFYASMTILALIGAKMFLLLGAIGACAASCVLAYLLYAKVKTICLLCTALYVINFLMLIQAVQALF